MDNVNEIIVEDKSLIAPRVPEIEKSALNKIVSPETKQRKYYCLFIDWNDKKGVKHYSFFQFGGSGKGRVSKLCSKYIKEMDVTKRDKRREITDPSHIDSFF